MNERVLALANKQAAICKVFGSPTRVLILWTLGEDERTVSDVAETIETSLQNASQHLRLMKDRGILDSRRDGHAVYYRVAAPKWLSTCTVLRRAAEGHLTDDGFEPDTIEISLQEEFS